MTGVSGITVQQSPTGLRFPVHVQPRASHAGIGGVHGGALKVRVSAPPVDGAANAAVVAVLAEALGVARSCVRIVGGATSRRKMVEVDGVDRERLRKLMTALPVVREP